MTKLLLTFVFILSAAVAAQHRPDHHAQMNARGAKAMGFDQAATTHHFLLHADGGTIQVTVKDPNDATNLAAIRAHLPRISKMFAAGDFSMPHFIHEDNVPGTEGMKRMRNQIAYAYEGLRAAGACASPRAMPTRSRPCISSCAIRLPTKRPAIRCT